MSRRELRERERRAAAALAAGQVHPSGVVDFEPRDLGADFVPDDFGVHDTADIWAALSRRTDQADESGAPDEPTHGRRAARSVVPEQFAAPAPAAAPPADLRDAAPTIAPVTDELLDRVREVVFREHEQAQTEAPRTRREARAKRAAETIDGMPAAWFQVDPEPAEQPQAVELHAERVVDEPPTAVVPAQPVSPAVPVAFTGPHPLQRDELDLAPTVAMSAVDRAEMLAASPIAEPPALPAVDVAPVGLDSISFSSAPVVPAEATDVHPFDATVPAVRPVEVDAAPAFVEPGVETGMVPGLEGFEAIIEQARRNREAGLPAAGAPTGYLPTDPTIAVTGTGEHLVTGSFRLPQSISATGAPRGAVDSADIDQFLDLAADEQKTSNVAPVSASRAVSGSVPTSAVPTTRRSRASVLPTVLAVVAGVMAVGVVVLLVGSWVLKLF